MSVEQLTNDLVQAAENELGAIVDRTRGSKLAEYHEMLAYHMGWIGEGSGPRVTGKRIRPVILLLTTLAAGGKWEDAMPAAAAVELLHNFSLIHDDIEDNSPLRRGRPTVWKKWGIPQAINAGDAMFTLAFSAMLGLKECCGSEAAITATEILHRTCLHLTQGQYLDISFESRENVKIEEYWLMVEGKTAALFSACTEIGALCAQATRPVCEKYKDFGRNLGLAFQAVDDYLGIWGDAALTGKSSESDLVTGKKSLPVIFGLCNHAQFATRWRKGCIKEKEAQPLADLLEQEGAREFTQQQAARLTNEALTILESTNPQGEAAEGLLNITNKLLRRET